MNKIYLIAIALLLCASTSFAQEPSHKAAHHHHHHKSHHKHHHPAH